MNDDDVGLGLADAIATVRAELEQAITAGESSAVAFRSGPVEMEFQVSWGEIPPFATDRGREPLAPRSGRG